MKENRPVLFHARAIVPKPGRLVGDAALLCRKGRVAWCGPWCERPETGDTEEIDLGDTVVLPGFVNAHTHLELTDMEGLLTGEKGFVPWVRSMRRVWRRWSREQRRASLLHGVRRCLEAGVTCVGQIAASPSCDAVLPRASPLRMRVFHEVVAPGWTPGWPMVAAAAWRGNRMRRTETRRDPGADRLRFALAPHAPYSVSRAALRHCIARAMRRREPLTIHAAETEEELAFCRDGSGEMAEFLRRKHLLGPFWRPPGESPIAFLARLGMGRVARPLIAHANYATPDEIRWMGRKGVAVAWCPPSHRFFGHRPWPLREMLEAGVPVCIATDSLASSDTLSPLEAVREVRAASPLLDADAALASITSRPAHALGWDDAVGTLTEGRFADFSVWRIDAPVQNVLETVLQGDAAGEGVWVGGRAFETVPARS